MTWENVADLGNQAALLAVIAVGMTLVVVTKGIDLSVGSVYGLCAVLAAYASQWGVLPALLIPLAAGAAIGGVQGWLIGRKRLAPFIVTLSGLLFARGLARFITGEGQQTFAVPADSGLLTLGDGAVPVALTVALICGSLLQRTPFGLRLRAVGAAEDTSGLMGVPVARTKTLVYMLSGTLAGLAGAVSAAQTGSAQANLGMGMELEAIAAVAIGGTALSGGAGTVAGTLAGVAVLSVIRDVADHAGGVSPDVQAVITGILLIVIVVTQALLHRKRSGAFTQTE